MEEKSIYSKIRGIRQAKGLTVNNLAEKIGEDYQKVGRIERGERSITLDYLMKVSKALDTPVEDFFSEKSIDKKLDQPTNNLELLNRIVVLVEENYANLPFELDARGKGKLISKLYELALKFPEKEQPLFVKSFFDSFQILA